MPNRLVRDGFVDSESVCALSDWTHRVYINLLIRSDDAGRFDGRLEYIRSHLFPLGSSRRSKDFEDALLEMISPKDQEGQTLPALLIKYEYAGKPFVQLIKVVRSSPAVTSKFPWRDGSYRIDYAKRSTRDGEKEFVVTSLTDGIDNPSSRDRPPSDPPACECTETGTGTKSESKTEADTRASPKTPALFRELTDFYCSEWQKKYGKKYPFRKIDGVKCAELMEAVGGSLDDAKGVIVRYLADESDFCRGHSCGLLVSASQLPKFMVSARSGTGPKASPSNVWRNKKTACG